MSILFAEASRNSLDHAAQGFQNVSGGGPVWIDLSPSQPWSLPRTDTPASLFTAKATLRAFHKPGRRGIAHMVSEGVEGRVLSIECGLAVFVLCLLEPVAVFCLPG